MQAERPCQSESPASWAISVIAFLLHNQRLQGLTYPDLPVLITEIGFSYYQVCDVR
jgi:hypothetical protein